MKWHKLCKPYIELVNWREKKKRQINVGVVNWSLEL